MFDVPDYCKKMEGQMIYMGYNSQKVAIKSGYSPNTVNKALTGENTSVKALVDILRVLGLELTVRLIKER